MKHKYNHYYKDTSHLDGMDVYRILKEWEVTDPCIQHAIKKLLCAGKRGVKDEEQDVQEAIDTLERYQDMKAEEEMK